MEENNNTSEPSENELNHELERRHKQIDNFVKKTYEETPVSEDLQPVEEAKIIEKEFISEYDLHLFHNGTHYKIFDKFGAQLCTLDGKSGAIFTTWAPNAIDVSVIGDFNYWDDEKNPMKKLNEGGVWSIFIPGITEGMKYKFSIHSPVHFYRIKKADPYAFYSEVRPKTASVVHNINKYKWNDNEWMNSKHDLFGKPMSVYELHLGSWRKDYENKDFPNEWGFLNYRQIAYEIVRYVKEQGYTHIELLPIMEHPLDISWGYQVSSYYSPTSRFGTPEDFMFFVDHCHQNGIGVILDWVPAHFPTDDFSLAFFDGKQIYAYDDWRRGYQKDWGTFIFDFGRNEVINFLIANALFWIEKYHIDGLRVDAVASMLYLDYSKDPGEWLPNIYGGRENLEAIDFIKHLNDIIHKYYTEVITIAEESTAWPGVTHSVHHGGLGFNFKWNMGWMNDILFYFSKDPVHRKYHQGKITFSLWYAFNENFILPVSHDENVHGKRSLLNKMPGDLWQKFANLRTFFGFMFGHPGKKLNFMTNDIAQFNEWNSDVGMDWNILNNELNNKLNYYVKDLNTLYRDNRAFWEMDFNHEGFLWIDFSDAANSIISFIRISADKKQKLIYAFNMTPVIRENYMLGVTDAGYYKEILNSDADIYGGSGKGNHGGINSQSDPINEFQHSIKIMLPPLSVVIFKWEL